MSTSPLPFEAALADLESCVGVLEQGGLTLEEALARFETGMRLVTHCEQLLDAAELRVTQLLAASDDYGEASPDSDDEPAF